MVIKVGASGDLAKAQSGCGFYIGYILHKEG
mgnify:CR=1 FL=1